jgi:glucan phosphoethanolaminetransferase (alkaline phosphatase superfamily)
MVFALEAAFWMPFWMIPFAVRLLTGQIVSAQEVIVCLYVSLLLAFMGAQLGPLQLPYRVLIFVALAVGSSIATGVALFHLGVATPNIMLAVMDSNPAEAAEFLGGAYSVEDYALAALTFIPLLPLAIQARYGMFWSPRPKTAVWLLVLLVFQVACKYAIAPTYSRERTLNLIAAEFPAKTYPIGSYTPGKPYFQLLQAIKIRHQLARLRSSPAPVEGVRSVDPPQGPRTYVVVVGESLAKGHMHIYGYGRPTTPVLDELARRGELLAFTDAVTSHAQTVPALVDALTWQPADGSDRRSIIDVLNAAGFKTYWVSNQPSVGAFDNFVSLITHAASSHVWLNAGLTAATPDPATGNDDTDIPDAEATVRGDDPRERQRGNFDEGLLPIVAEILARRDESKVIFVHLMGSHVTYRARYPQTAEYFTDLPEGSCRSQAQQRIINDYDNTVRYNDSVVGRIIEAVRDAGGESFVVYFSDHGEEVYDFRHFAHHNDEVLSPYMAEIPFLVWLSDDFKSHHADFVAGLPDTVGRPYVNSSFSHSLADLARVDFRGMEPKRSLFSKEFEPEVRITAERDYDAFKRNWSPDEAHSHGMRLLDCHREAGNGPVAATDARATAPGP